MINILKTTGKSILYSSGICLFGLMQILLLYMRDNLHHSDFISYTKIVQSCGILFFSTSISGSLMVDFYLHKDNFYGKLLDTFIFYFVPTAIIFASTCVYLFIFGFENKMALFERLESSTYAILSSSILNLSIGKGIFFYQEYKKGN